MESTVAAAYVEEAGPVVKATQTSGYYTNEIVACWKCGHHTNDWVRMVNLSHRICQACDQRRSRERRVYKLAAGDTAADYVAELIARVEYEREWGYCSEERFANQDWLVEDSYGDGHNWHLWNNVALPLRSMLTEVETKVLKEHQMDLMDACKHRYAAQRRADKKHHNEVTYESALCAFVQPLARSMARMHVGTPAANENRMSFDKAELHDLYVEGLARLPTMLEQQAAEHYEELGLDRVHLSQRHYERHFWNAYNSEHDEIIRRLHFSEATMVAMMMKRVIAGVELLNTHMRVTPCTWHGPEDAWRASYESGVQSMETYSALMGSARLLMVQCTMHDCALLGIDDLIDRYTALRNEASFWLESVSE